MNEKLKIILLKALLFGYAEITKETTEAKSHDEVFYKQALEIAKYFKKQTPEKLIKADRELLDKVYRKFVSFDAEYFNDKLGSPYLCMITLLDYLVNEKKDLSLRAKFGHYDFTRIDDELSKSDNLKKVYFDSNKYLNAVLNKLEM